MRRGKPVSTERLAAIEASSDGTTTTLRVDARKPGAIGCGPIPTHLEKEPWAKYVSWLPEEESKRYALPAWQYTFFRLYALILRPRDKRVIVAEILESRQILRRPKDDEAKWSDTPSTRVRVHAHGFPPSECVIPNSSVLRCHSTWTPELLKEPIPEAWLISSPSVGRHPLAPLTLTAESIPIVDQEVKMGRKIRKQLAWGF